MKYVAIVVAVSACTLGCKAPPQWLRTDSDEAVSNAVQRARAADQARAASEELEESNRELEDAKREFEYAKHKLEEAKEEVASDLETFTTKTNRELDTLAAKLDRLQRDAVNAPANAKQALSEQAASLEARREALLTKTKALGQRAGEELAKAKADVANAVASLRGDVDQALEELGNNTHNTGN